MLYKLFLILLTIIPNIYSSPLNNLLVVAIAKRQPSQPSSILKFEIVGSDKDPTKSISKAEITLQKLTKSLNPIVQKENIKTTQPQIQMETSNEGKVSFYETIIQLQIESSKNIGEVIAIADKFGTLIDLSYRVSEEEKQELRDELVKEAFDQAQSKAEIYSESIGLQLDGVQSIEINDNLEDPDDQSLVVVKVSILYHLASVKDQKYMANLQATNNRKTLKLLDQQQWKLQENKENLTNDLREEIRDKNGNIYKKRKQEKD